MNFLQGKSPAERNKIIAASVLGLLAFVALSYTFLFSSSPRTTANNNSNSNKNANIKIAAATQNSSSTNNSKGEIRSPEEIRNEELPSSLPADPFPPAGSTESSRNIFALYDPADHPAPVKADLKPIPTPTPAPPPPLPLMGVSPSMVYARSKDFTLEVAGDKFTPETRILFNGQEVPTKFASPQRLSAQISSGLISSEGQRQIMARTPDGKLFSNVLTLNVQAPPIPNFSFVGLVARKRYNNDTATLQDKASKQYQNVRLGESIGRFKVVSISSKEVVMQDTELGFRHNLPFNDEKSGGRIATNGPSNPYGNGSFQPVDPNMQYQQQAPPNPYMQQPQYPPPPQPSSTRSEDEEDDNP